MTVSSQSLTTHLINIFPQNNMMCHKNNNSLFRVDFFLLFEVVCKKLKLQYDELQTDSTASNVGKIHAVEVIPLVSLIELYFLPSPRVDL